MKRSKMFATDRRSILVSVLVALVGLARVFVFWREPDGELVQRVPDDAFYYLVLARNHVLRGHWTFDQSAPATGFHLLWAYFISGLLTINPRASFHDLFAEAGIVQVACISLAAGILTRSATRLFGRDAAWGIALVFLSASVLLQAGSLMESAFVICAAAATVELLAQSEGSARIKNVLLAFLLGWLLEMCRSDAGMLPAAFLLLHLSRVRKAGKNRSMLVLAAFAMLGACCGIGTLVLHTHHVSGEWVQASARQKLFWSSVSPRIPVRQIIGTPLSVLQPLHNAVSHYDKDVKLSHTLAWIGHLTGGIVVALTLAGAIMTARSCGTLARGVLWVLGGLVAAYCCFYRHDGAVMDWYVSNFVVSMSLITAASAAWWAARAPVSSFSIMAIVAASGIACSITPTYPWQQSMYRAGQYLCEHPSLRPVGAFNAGIIGFFAGKAVTNLDGLVNDDIFQYAKRGQLVEYINRRSIRYIVDYPFMLQDSLQQRRGGYHDGNLTKCIESSKDIFPADPDNSWEGGRIELFQLTPQCGDLGLVRRSSD